MTRPIVVGITGASGAIYGLRLLDTLRELDVETHLVVTGPGEAVVRHELGMDLDELASRADRHWAVDDLFAPIASGSFLTGGMVVAPCSIRTLSAVACARSSNLLERAADVTLKEHRPLVLLVRESPLHLGHLRLMASATEAGAVIAPPVPAFYGRPRTIEDLVRHSVARALDHLGVEHRGLMTRWGSESS